MTRRYCYPRMDAFRYADWTGMEPFQIVVGRLIMGSAGGLFVAWAIANAVRFFTRHRWFPWAWLGLNGLLTVVAVVMAIFDPESRQVYSACSIGLSYQARTCSGRSGSRIRSFGTVNG